KHLDTANSGNVEHDTAGDPRAHVLGAEAGKAVTGQELGVVDAVVGAPGDAVVREPVDVATHVHRTHRVLLEPGPFARIVTVGGKRAFGEDDLSPVTLGRA